MDNKTVIKYIVEGCRMFKVPIINIIPSGDINIKISFPEVNDIFINTNKKVIIKQKDAEPYPHFNLFANNDIISYKYGFFNNGTIIITTFGGKCEIEETHEMVYDG
jgi:hypothetical protein